MVTMVLKLMQPAASAAAGTADESIAGANSTVRRPRRALALAFVALLPLT